MKISPLQISRDYCVLPWTYFNSAREGFCSILRSKDLKGRTILLPAYIGHSTREGSGVFDPIVKTKSKFDFYHMGKDLHIDFNDVKAKISKNSGGAILLIHYFGFKDKNLDEIKKWAQKKRLLVIEDFAHAYFTFFQEPYINFDYAFFSIHKLFPLDVGGMVLTTRKIKGSKGSSDFDLFGFNINTIIARRVENYHLLLKILKDKQNTLKFKILRSNLKGNVPQTFPILLKNRQVRDKLYFQLNKDGYGVVSLYHSLVKPIDESYVDEHYVSSRILNLPIHQDADGYNLKKMADRLCELLKMEQE